jgi:hypothetical protein
MTNHVIEIWDINKVIPYGANAKKHPKEQVLKLANSITKFGWTQPIVVWKNGEIIAGHGRRLAALHLGLQKVPVIVRSDLNKYEADALRLADNRVTSTEYDQTAIQEELRRLSEELEGTNLELSDLGFDDKEIDFSLADLGEINENFFVDDISEAVEEQKTANVGKLKDTDDAAAPVTDAFGFKRVTIAQSRTIRNLMPELERRTGKQGVEALIEAMQVAANG